MEHKSALMYNWSMKHFKEIISIARSRNKSHSKAFAERVDIAYEYLFNGRELPRSISHPYFLSDLGVRKFDTPKY